MEPPDRHSDTMDGAACAACGVSVPPEQVRILARRDDLTFAELPCSRCGSTSLAIVLAGRDADVEDVAARPGQAERRRREAAPVTSDDVLDMHLFLSGWTGDARSLVEHVPGRPARPR